MAEMERKAHTSQEREKLTRLLTIFDTGLGLGLGNEEKQPSVHTKRRVTIADTRQSVESDSSAQLTQTVKTFYVDSWPEVQVKKDNIIIPNAPGSSRSMIEGTPITIETAIELRHVVLGSTVHSFSKEWRKSGLMFHDLASAWAYGLQTLRCGSRGLVLCIQGYLLKHLLFAREYTSSLVIQNALKPNDFERRRALVSGLCEILWQAGEGKRCCVCLTQEEDCYKSDYKCRADGVTEKLHLYEFKKFQDLQIFMKRNLSHLEYENSNGCILFLYSLVFSRTIQKVYEDMDVVPGENRNNKLLTDNEELTISLLNLVLTGRAVKNLHNGNVVFDTSGQMLPKALRGIKERSHIGFLFWDKGENDDEKTEIGSMMKTPRNPVWVTLVNNQFGLLFSTNKDLVSDWRVEHRFVLHYYTGLSCHAPTALTVDTLSIYKPPVHPELKPWPGCSSCKSYIIQAREEVDLTEIGCEEKLKSLSVEMRTSGKRGASLKLKRVLQSELGACESKKSKLRKGKSLNQEKLCQKQKPAKKLETIKVAEMMAFANMQSGNPSLISPEIQAISQKSRSPAKSSPQLSSPAKSPSKAKSPVKSSAQFKTPEKSRSAARSPANFRSVQLPSKLGSPTKSVKSTSPSKLPSKSRSPIKSTKKSKSPNKSPAKSSCQYICSAKLPAKLSSPNTHKSSISAKSPAKLSSPNTPKSSTSFITKDEMTKSEEYAKGPTRALSLMAPIHTHRDDLSEAISASFNLLNSNDYIDMDLLNQEDGIEQKRGTENFVGEGEYGYNYVSNAATNQFDRSDAEGSRENPHFQNEMQPKRGSIVGYFQNLTKEQQCGVVGFLTNVVSVLGNISSQKPISMRSPEVSCFSTCSTPSAIERKTPLIVDKQDQSKFDDVQVNPSKLRTAEMKCLTSKDPSRMLLNKVADLVFSQEEYLNSKGVAGLDQH